MLPCEECPEQGGLRALAALLPSPPDIPPHPEAPGPGQELRALNLPVGRHGRLPSEEKSPAEETQTLPGGAPSPMWEMEF